LNAFLTLDSWCDIIYLNANKLYAVLPWR